MYIPQGCQVELQMVARTVELSADERESFIEALQIPGITLSSHKILWSGRKPLVRNMQLLIQQILRSDWTAGPNRLIFRFYQDLIY